MKRTQKLVSWLVACAVSVAMAANAASASGENKEYAGKVVRIKGAARYSTGNNVWQPLKVGTILKSGSVVQSAADSFVDIVIGGAETPLPGAAAGAMQDRTPVAEQDVVRVLEDSVLAIDKLTAIETGGETITDTQLDLRSGRIFGTVKKMPAASRFEVKIPNGVAGVRGTIYTISADGVVSVLVGSLVVAYTRADGTVVTQVVTGGWQYDARTGELTPIPPLRQGELNRLRNDCYYVIYWPPRGPHDHTVQHVTNHGKGKGKGKGKGQTGG